jgi:thiamine transport system substrate-binding protein
MYPAFAEKQGQVGGFETLIEPGKSLLLGSDQAAALRKAAIAEWQAALAK